ncbi:MAG: dihydrofolate reductase [Acidobacteriota bacterium]|nr:dihydrofolate reductase [Acidobacteriota bacterium]
MHDDFPIYADRFADIQILRYQVPGFEDLSLSKKKLLYYLYAASLAGRDIIWDQNFKFNLIIRRTLEEIVKHYTGDRTANVFKAFMDYTKRVWFSNGIHHHYSTAKFLPGFGSEDLRELMQHSPNAAFPLKDGQSPDDLLSLLTPVLFHADVAARKVNKEDGVDLAATSAVNFYEDVSQDEVEAFYKDQPGVDDPEAPSFGLNSKLVKQDGRLVEQTWKVGGMYGKAVEVIVYWLEKAVTVAENDAQRRALSLLAEYYKTGDLKCFDQYNIAWVQDTDSDIDAINGFIEVYNDPMGYRGTYESIVSVKDPVATKRIDTIAANAQWFEDHAPIDENHKKEEVKGISGSVINVVVEAGDAHPSTPIGVNLPNADWIREKHGSKSVNLANIVNAYNQAKGKVLEEFAYDEEELERGRAYLELSDNLHTDMHEAIGHASGKLCPGVGTPKETLKNYASTLEEARADLVALYYLLDPRLVELELMPSLEVGKAQYDQFVRNGLMLQLRRLMPGEQLEEDHMRNRQLIAQWAFEHGEADQVIERVTRDDKTYFLIRDYEKLRALFGRLLRECQRIKSVGDFQAAKELVETYGVKVEEDLHREVLRRFEKLDMAPYFGFINPKLEPKLEHGAITDVTISYPTDFTEQMLEYAASWSFLPNEN